MRLLVMMCGLVAIFIVLTLGALRDHQQMGSSATPPLEQAGVVLLADGRLLLYDTSDCRLSSCLSRLWLYDPRTDTRAAIFGSANININAVGINREGTFLLWQYSLLYGGIQSRVETYSMVYDLSNANTYRQYGWGLATIQPLRARAYEGLPWPIAPRPLHQDRLALLAVGLLGMLGIGWGWSWRAAASWWLRLAKPVR